MTDDEKIMKLLKKYIRYGNISDENMLLYDKP